MAIGRVNTGGGLSNAFAVIAVTYPSGSVCTCTNGTKTLSAKDTSGSFLFLIPAAGTWTASCTDGTETASQAVSITAQYQAESVRLSYFIWSGEIFVDGQQYTEYTGEWAPNVATVLDGVLRITFEGTPYSKGDYDSTSYLANPIDLTDFSTLSAVAYRIDTEYIYEYYLGIWNVNGNALGSLVGKVQLPSGGSGTVPISMSCASLTGPYFIGCRVIGNCAFDEVKLT